MKKTLQETSKAPQQIYRTKEETQPAFRPRETPRAGAVRDATKDLDSLMSSKASMTQQEHAVSVGMAKTMASDHLLTMNDEIAFIESQLKPGESRDIAVQRMQSSIASTSAIAQGLSGDAAQAYDEMYIPSAKKMSTAAMSKWSAEQLQIDYSTMQSGFNDFLNSSESFDSDTSRAMLNLWDGRMAQYSKGGNSGVFESAAKHISMQIAEEVLKNPAASSMDRARMLLNKNFMGLAEVDENGTVNYLTNDTAVNAHIAKAVNAVIRPAYEDLRKGRDSTINAGFKSNMSELNKLETAGRALLKSEDPREQAEGAMMLKRAEEGKATISKQYDTFTSASGTSYSGLSNPMLGKQGGSKSWRNNNPGNISGASGLLYGAKGIHLTKGAKASGDRKSLVFGSMEEGWKAMETLLDKNYSSGPINKTFSKYQEAPMTNKIAAVEKAGIDTSRSWGSLSGTEKQTFMKIWAQHEGFTEGTVFDSGVDAKGLMNVAAAKEGTHKTNQKTYNTVVSEFRKLEPMMFEEAKRTGDYSKIEGMIDDVARLHTKLGVKNAKVFGSEKLGVGNKRYSENQKEIKRLYDNAVKAAAPEMEAGMVDPAAVKEAILKTIRESIKVEGDEADSIKADIQNTKTAMALAADPNTPNNLMNNNDPASVQQLADSRHTYTGDMKVKVDEYFATGYPSKPKMREDEAILSDIMTQEDYAALDALSSTSSKRVADARGLSLLQTFNSATAGDKNARATFERKMVPGNVHQRELTSMVKLATKGLMDNGINGFINNSKGVAQILSIPKLEAEFVQSQISDGKAMGEYLFAKEMVSTFGGEAFDTETAKFIDDIKIGKFSPSQKEALENNQEYLAAQKSIAIIDKLPTAMRTGLNVAAQKLAIAGYGQAIQPMLDKTMMMFKPLSSSGDGAYVQETAKLEDMFTRSKGASREITMEKVAMSVTEEYLQGKESFTQIEKNVQSVREGQYTVFEEDGQHFLQIFSGGSSFFTKTIPFDPDKYSIGYTVGGLDPNIERYREYGVIVKE